MTDPFDVTLTDEHVLAEVELMARLMVAANESDERLDARQIDSLLGVGS